MLESNVSIDFHASITALFDFDGLSDRSSVRFYAICSHVKHSVAMSIDSGFCRFDADLGSLERKRCIFPKRFFFFFFIQNQKNATTYTAGRMLTLRLSKQPTC